MVYIIAVSCTGGSMWILRIIICYSVIGGASCRTRDESSSTKSLYDAAGRKVDESQANTAKPAWRELLPSDGFSGIGVLGVSFGVVSPDVCTAFLIDAGVASGPAYVVTNAHCNFFQHLGTDMLRADEYRVNQPTDYFLNLNHYVSVPEKGRVQVKFKQLTYITESGTDLAIFETVHTLAEMIAKGYKPLKLSRTIPAIGQNVRLVGVPLRTVSYDRQSLHISSCQVGEEVALRNGIYGAPHSVKHRCSSIPGFSGGPLIADDGTVVLLNSHGADDFSEAKACTYAAMPCEVQANGEVVVDRETNYAQYVHTIAGCFDRAGVFKLNLANCGLPH